MIGRLLWQGSVAGSAGAPMMTLGEKAGQRLAGRAHSSSREVGFVTDPEERERVFG